MLQIRCAGQEVEVSGSPIDLRDLADLIRLGDGGFLRMEAVADPSPYTHAASKVQLLVDDDEELLLTSLDADYQTLRLIGPRRFLDLLAGNVADQANDPDGHLHIEWFPDHFYLAPGSLSLVVSVQKNPE